MSLIQEALKRKQEEEGRDSPNPAYAALPTPMPILPADSLAESNSTTKVLRSLCYSVVCIGAFAGIFALYRSFTLEGEGTNSSISMNEPQVNNLVVVDPVSSIESLQLVLHEEPGIVDASSVIDIAVPLQDSVKPMAQTQSNTLAPAQSVIPTLADEAPMGDITWPLLNVTGVLARPDATHSSAVINSSLVDIGTRVEGVMLVEVKQTGVVFNYLGEEKFVRVGQTTNR